MMGEGYPARKNKEIEGPKGGRQKDLEISRKIIG